RIDSGTRPDECTDGLSNTLMFIEDAARPERWARGRLLPGGRYTGGVWADSNGVSALNGYSDDGLTQGGSCALNCSNNGDISGFHPLGANILLGDGSARFLSRTTDLNVLAALVTRANDEPLTTSDL